MSSFTWRSKRACRIASSLLIAVLALLVVAGCGDGDDSQQTKSSATKQAGKDAKNDRARSDAPATGDCAGNPTDVKMPTKVADREGMYDSAPCEPLDASKKYPVEITTNKGSFTIQVDPKLAPIAAANFVFLAKQGYYNGIVFHRVIKDFMIQGGDPAGTGTGGPGYSLTDDPVEGTYTRGTVAMANAGPNTGGSQFFVVHGTEVQLPPDYVIFGSVDAAGMKVVDAIAAVKTTSSPNGELSVPTETITIKSAQVS